MSGAMSIPYRASAIDSTKPKRLNSVTTARPERGVRFCRETRQRAASYLPRARWLDYKAVEFHLGRSLNHGIGWQAVVGGVPRRLFNGSALQRLRHQLADLRSGQWDETAILMLVELGAEIERVDPRVIAVQNEEVFRLTKKLSLLHQLAVLRSEGNTQLFAFGPDDGGGFQKNEPVLRIRVVLMDGD
ncbi:hypothetical protein [Bradyrhizobium embrapense]